MSPKYLHIVSFNVPDPPDYGGVIDIYYKVKALKEAGIHVILHCFTYGRRPSKELEEMCLRVFYYPRLSGIRYFLRSTPYIIATRTSKSMPENLLGDSFPVLFEGLHSTSVLEMCVRARKKVLIRTHNIEHRYYHFLSVSEKNLFRKIFFRLEARKLERYERVLDHADQILAIAEHETEYFNQRYPPALFVPAFHKFDRVSCPTGSGDYLLFHGNLSVPENSKAFMDLSRTVFSRISYPVIVAGKAPPASLIRRATEDPHMTVVPDPDEEQMENLIRNAHIHLLYTAQSTGIKLKLIHALYAGRHCLVNRPMIEGTGLAHLCHLGGTAEETLRKVDELMNTPFTEDQLGIRKKTLSEYSNRVSAEKIIRLLG
ncbi:MAG: glycosyltransferase family 1 protein [Bacteroidales bacterium]